MHIAFSKIVGLPVFELRDQNMLGKISDIVFQDDLKVVAFLIHTGSLFEKPKALFTDEIIEFSKDAAIVNEEGSVSDLSENIRLRDLIEMKQSGIHHPVVDKVGNKIGSCDEIIFVPNTFQISRIHVKNWFGEKIFDQKNIKGFENGKFIVKNTDTKIRPELQTSKETIS